MTDYSVEALAPYFAQAEKRLNTLPWLMPPNENNDLLRRGAAKLGIPAAAISRNVKGCWNLSSCSLGRQANAKQSMLVTTSLAALDQGGRLLTEVCGKSLKWLTAESLRSIAALRCKMRL